MNSNDGYSFDESMSLAVLRSTIPGEESVMSLRQPIRIDENEGFNISNGIISGEGNVENPWLISGWEIDASGSGCGIYIGNTTEHFMISNCTIWNASGEQSHFYRNAGLLMYNSPNGQIVGNLVSGCGFGIYLSSSPDCSVMANRVENCTQNGIALWDESDRGFISNNSCISNGQYGIQVRHSNATIVDGNTVSFSGQSALYIESTNNNTIRRNIAEHSVDTGIESISNDYLVVHDNDCRFNSLYTIYLRDNHNAKIFHNHFLYPGLYQSFDDTGENQWDDGYPSGGNSWYPFAYNDEFKGNQQDLPGSDGISDIAYFIEMGESRASDRFPFAYGHMMTRPPANSIRINSNSEFDQLHGISSGNGTLENPWVMENLTIASQADYGLYIGNTTEHFIVRNMDVFDTSGEMFGIYLHNSTNGTIDANYVFHPRAWFQGQGFGVVLSDCVNISISHNVLNSTGTGVLLFGDSVYNTISENMISNNFHGVYLDSSSSRSINNLVFLNEFHSNVIQAYDERAGNRWDNGTCGNYWDDYFGLDENGDGIGDQPYIFGDSRDNKPLMYPPSLQLPDDQPDSGGGGHSGTWIIADSDMDGTPDNSDAFPHDPTEWKDTDGDGMGDNSDTDIDGDGFPNEEDAFPHDPTEWKDTDGDGIGDNSDTDIDGDGVPNEEDAFPYDLTEWKDTDGDGIGDNADLDDGSAELQGEEDSPQQAPDPASEQPGAGIIDLIRLTLIIFTVIFASAIFIRRRGRKPEKVSEMPETPDSQRQ